MPERSDKSWTFDALLKSLVPAAVIALAGAVLISWVASQNSVTKEQFAEAVGELNKKIAVGEANNLAITQRLERIEKKIDALHEWTTNPSPRR